MMKKLLLAMLLGFVSLSANSLDGEAVYKAKCSACHMKKGMMDEGQMRQKMQNATKEEKVAMREQMMMKMQKSGMRAPTMPMVSKRLKKFYPSKEEFVAFVTDYIQNPSQAKGHCMPMAYKRFGTMPPIGKGLSKEEREAVATWLYENFKGSWGSSMEGKACEMRNSSMKCGAGKCGGVKPKQSMKCGSGKCGSR